jgi:hypothetical protein
VKSNSCLEGDKKEKANTNQLTSYGILRMNSSFLGMKKCPLESLVGQPIYELCVILSKPAQKCCYLNTGFIQLPELIHDSDLIKKAPTYPVSR